MAVSAPVNTRKRRANAVENRPAPSKKMGSGHLQLQQQQQLMLLQHQQLQAGPPEDAASWDRAAELEKLVFREKARFLPPSNSPPDESKLLLTRLLSLQKSFLPNHDYLKRVQKDEITEAMRREIVTWLYKMNTFLKYQSETFLAAVNLFDRSLSVVKARQNYLHLVAATCFLIASKTFEDTYTHPTFKELALAGNNAFQEADVEKMEKVLLTKLQWQLNVVTPATIFALLVPEIRPLFASLPENRFGLLVAQANLLLDAFALEYPLLRYTPAELAAAALVYTLLVGFNESNLVLIAKLLVATDTTREALTACINDLRMIYFNGFPTPSSH